MSARRSVRAWVLLGLTSATAAWVLTLTPVGRLLEDRGLDVLFVLRGRLPPPPDLVIVAVDELSFAEIGLRWPWPRSLHARLVDRLREEGARVLALDILFAEPGSPEEDKALAVALRRAGNVVLVADVAMVDRHDWRQTLRVGPLAELGSAAAGVGVATIFPERDGVIRRAHVLAGGLPSFAAVVARQAGWDGPLTSTPFVINYLGPSPAIHTISYARVLAKGDLPEGTFRGKIVLVGRAGGPSLEPDRPLPDSHATPFFGWRGGTTPGVEIHATIVDNLIRSRAVTTISVGVRLVWTLALALATAFLVRRLTVWTALAATIAIAVGQGSLAFAMFAGTGLWVPWVAPALAIGTVYLGMLALRWREAEHEKAFIRHAFQHYVHPAMVREILDNPERLKLGGQSVEGTTLFSDLEGFTRIAESLTPEALVLLLNEYLSAMTGVIQAHRGMLNRTVGDAILALWGVPLPDPEHPLGACRAALAMNQELRELNQRWRARGFPALRARIGIHTGRMVVGNIGSAERFDYTAHGDSVNVASRLEALNKLYGTGVLIGEDTARRVEEALTLRELDRVRVVGRAAPISIYECLAERGAVSTEQRALLEVFPAALSAYRERNWQRALASFQEAMAIVPGDGPSRLYVERIRGFLAVPPPADWDSVHQATTTEE